MKSALKKTMKGTPFLSRNLKTPPNIFEGNTSENARDELEENAKEELEQEQQPKSMISNPIGEVEDGESFKVVLRDPSPYMVIEESLKESDEINTLGHDNADRASERESKPYEEAKWLKMEKEDYLNNKEKREEEDAAKDYGESDDKTSKSTEEDQKVKKSEEEE